MADQNNVNVDALENQPPPNIPPHGNRRRGLSSMSRFYEVRHAHTTGADELYLNREPPLDGSIQIYVPDGAAYVSRLFVFCVEMFDALEDDDWQQILSVYSSAICAVFPGMQTSVKQTLRQMGLDTEIVRLPSNADRLGIAFPARGYFPTVLVMMGQLCLIPFKNIGLDNYEKFLKARSRGIRSHIGCVSEADVFPYLKLNKAATIRKGFGCVLSFKRDLLTAIDRISGNPGIVSHMCDYLLGILAWTDMSALVSINEALLMTNSPVLRDVRVASEILKLGAAYRVICKHHQPHFFRILGESHLFHLLNRNNFPILHAVAVSLRSEENASVAQFVPAMAKENKLVKALCQLHKAAAIQVRTLKYQQDLVYLTANDGEEPIE